LKIGPANDGQRSTTRWRRATTYNAKPRHLSDARTRQKQRDGFPATWHARDEATAAVNVTLASNYRLI